MAPPPDNMGDEFPDFDSMSVEEQMAWLESLAKRQGVGDDELTTNADVDIPVPENAQVDEPGYVPFEGSRSAREMNEAAEETPAQAQEPSAQADSEPAAETEFESVEAESGMEEALADLESEAAAGDDDATNWLDDLTAQPDDDVEALGDLDDADFDDADELFADIDALEEQAFEAEVPDWAEEEEAPSPEPALETQAAAADSDDPLGGMDPMLWLESLAARQGADASELTTSANASINEVDTDAVVDEPGYVPFEGSRSAREMKESTEEAPAHAEEPSAEPAVEEPAPVEMPETASMADDDADAEADLYAEAEEMLEGAEPMEWLETLAKRQGANDDELLTSAEVDVPDVAEDAVVDEPGYVEYDPLSILPPDQADALDEVLAFADDADDEGLSWLEDLAAEPDEDVEDFLSFEDEVYEEPDTFEDAIPEPSPAAAADDDPLAGMSEEDIVQAQVQGTLTGPQELAWLKRQARTLAETRESQETTTGEDSEPVEVAPAEPAELPDWLEEMRQTSEQDAVVEVDDVFGDEPDALIAEDAELSDWLSDPEVEGAADFEAIDLTEVSLDEDVDSLWAEAPEQDATPVDTGLPDDSELAAFVAGDFNLDEPDALAEALDEEYERKLAGEDEEPEWYTDAIARVAAEVPELDEAASEEITPAVAAAEPALAEAEPVDVPGWLAEEAAEESPAAAVDDSVMPDWLRGMEEESAEEPATPGEVPAWLAEEAAEADAAAADAVPDWLAGMEDEEEAEVMAPAVETLPPPVETAPAPALEAPAPVPSLAEIRPEVRATAAPAPVPTGELFDQYRERLDQDASDYPSRLGLARALRTNQQIDASMDHYELLIDADELLQDVTDDLRGMVTENPEAPRMQRLLGDALMRRGMLQDALDAYRNALDQL